MDQLDLKVLMNLRVDRDVFRDVARSALKNDLRVFPQCRSIFAAGKATSGNTFGEGNVAFLAPIFGVKSGNGKWIPEGFDTVQLSLGYGPVPYGMPVHL